MSLARVLHMPRPMAYVLPGGGALGAYQVGVLKALAEADLTPDMLVGVSAGAVNAALYAWNNGVSGVAHLEQIWRSLKRRDLLRVHPGRLALAFSGKRSSFLDSRHGEAFLRRQLGFRLIQHAPIPLVIVATNLHDGRPVALTEGDAVSAAVASSSFPAVYPPYEREGLLLIDGGVVADIPLDIAMAHGAASALVLPVPPLAAGFPPMRAIDLLFRASTFGVEAHGRSIMLRPPDGLDVVEVPAPPSTITTFSIGNPDAPIAEGYAQTKAWLAGIDGG